MIGRWWCELPADERWYEEYLHVNAEHQLGRALRDVSEKVSGGGYVGCKAYGWCGVGSIGWVELTDPNDVGPPWPDLSVGIPPRPQVSDKLVPVDVYPELRVGPGEAGGDDERCRHRIVLSDLWSFYDEPGEVLCELEPGHDGDHQAEEGARTDNGQTLLVVLRWPNEVTLDVTPRGYDLPAG